MSIGALVAKTQVGRAAAQIVVTHTLWEEVAGQAFARRTRPERFEKGTLFVRVATSSWAQELALHAPLILERMRARGVVIDKLRYTIGPVAPLDRSRPDPIPHDAFAQARAVELPEPMVESAMREITDPELRDAILATARVVVRRVTEQQLVEALRGGGGKPKIRARDDKDKG